MAFFESLLILVLIAVVLLQVARRLDLPYPAMLAGAGVCVAFIPGSPTIAIEPATTLALFITPALVDAAFDFPLGAARRFWVPLVALAVVAVLVTTAVVAWIGVAVAGLPVAAAIVLGAIVSPPDAAAASAVLRSVSIPRNSDAVIKGESLFNDATALLLFGEALSIQTDGGLNVATGLRLVLAAPGGILLGIAAALAFRRIGRFVTGTLGGNILQFVNAFIVWIAAEHIGLSPVLAIVAMAMTLARTGGDSLSARMRVHSYAVWSAVVFVLNVFAFLLMGMQAHTILARMPAERLTEALGFAGLILAVVVVVRLAIVVGFNRLASRVARLRGGREPATLRQGILVGWCGMRGLVTLAAALTLPAAFPERDLAVLTAFTVVLGTLVLQGATLPALVRLLRLDNGQTLEQELSETRVALAEAALATLRHEEGEEAESFRYLYNIQRETAVETSAAVVLRRRTLGLGAIAAQRRHLDGLQRDHRIGADAFNLLQEELDWRELSLLPDEERRMEES